MKVTKACENYFNLFQDRGTQKEQWAVITLMVLKVLSYITVAIPLGFGIAYGMASLAGRISKKKQEDLDRRMTTQANVILPEEKEDEPKVEAPIVVRAQKKTKQPTVRKRPELKLMTAMEVEVELEKVSKISDEVRKATSYKILVRKFFRSGNYKEAFFHLEQIPNKKFVLELKSQFALEIAKKGDYDFALHLAEQVYNEPWRKKGQPANETPESLSFYRELLVIVSSEILHLAGEGQIQQAQQLLDKMPEGKTKESTQVEFDKLNNP
jgi:hypothetical protein